MFDEIDWTSVTLKHFIEVGFFSLPCYGDATVSMKTRKGALMQLRLCNSWPLLWKLSTTPSSPLTHNISHTVSHLYAPPPLPFSPINDVHLPTHPPPPVSSPVSLFLMFNLNVTTPPLILSILIANNPIPSYVPALPLT